MSNLLENINLQKLKKLNYQEKNNLAAEIRKFLIYNLSKTGGHLSSNLGVVEIVIALHSILNSPEDIIIFDVGHQCYTHKILTNRKNKFETLRTKNGLSGFISTNESIHDIWETGHSSTSISAGIAYALANPDKIVTVIIGDSSIVNGVSLEALNHLGELNLKNIIIILNDNDMSISLPTGGFSKHLTSLNEDTVNILTHFNVNYFGPYDGHNIEKIETVIKNKILKPQNSAILHFKTIKGKGYKFAESDKLGNWHGVGKFDPINPEQKTSDPNFELWSQIISNQVELLMNFDDKIVVTTPAMSLGSKLTNIQKKYPKRFFDVGISEEHAVCFNAALGETQKFKPFLSIYSSFLQRSYDFLLTDLTRKNNHVVMGIDRCGFVGEDGPTHHGLWDVAFLNTLPNTTIFAPLNAKQSFEMLKYAFNQKKGLFAIRYEKDNLENKYEKNLKIPKKITWEILKNISKLNVISYGRSLRQVLKNKNLDVGIINATILNKIDSGIITMLDGKEILIIEEIIENNSLYEQILKFLYKSNLNIKIHKINVQNPFAAHATQYEQLEQESLNAKKIKEVILKIYEKLET